MEAKINSSNQEKRNLVGLPDLFIPMETLLQANLVPNFIPQIADPRIIIQTFNSPNTPILPGDLPRPKINMQVNLPSITKAPVKDIIVEDHRLSDEDLKRNEFLKKMLKEQFLRLSRQEEEKRVTGEYFENGISSRLGEEKKQKIVLLSSLED